MRALALRPNLAQAHINLGIVLRQQNRLDEAAAHYEHALALKPDSVEALNNLGIILWQQGRLDEAAAQHRQALALDRACAEAYSNLGCVLAKQRKPDEAAAVFQQALLFKPDYPEALNGLGFALGRQGRLDQAEAQFVRAIALRPDYAEVLNNLGVTLLDQGRLNEAAQVFERLQSLVPDSAEAEMGLASCYLVSGDFQRGWPAYERGCAFPTGSRNPACRAGRASRWPVIAAVGRRARLGGYDPFPPLRPAAESPGGSGHPGRSAGARPAVGLASRPGRVCFSSTRPTTCRETDFYLPLLSALARWERRPRFPAEMPYLWADPELSERWRAGTGPDRGIQDRHRLARLRTNFAGIAGVRFRWQFRPAGQPARRAIDQLAKGSWLGADREGRFSGSRSGRSAG